MLITFKKENCIYEITEEDEEFEVSELSNRGYNKSIIIPLEPAVSVSGNIEEKIHVNLDCKEKWEKFRVAPSILHDIIKNDFNVKEEK